MKRISIILTAVLMLASFDSNAFDLKSVLKAAAGNTASNDSTNSGGTGLGDLLGGLGNILGLTDVGISDLEGTWSYVKPAIAFQSDNLLKKAGGEAAASVIEGKLAPYYQKAGITQMKLTVKADSTFSMRVNRVTLNGSLEKDAEGNFVFNFKALGKIKIGRMTSVITRSGKNIDITFDASKLISLVSKIATLSGNSTVQSVSTLLQSYDGMNAGFQMSKDQTATTGNNN